MKIEQIYTECLSQGSYYITSGNEAVIIDPLRETQQYIEKAKKDNVRIKYVFETHFHADFVSGHIDLARNTGAKIVFGPNANTVYPVHNAKDSEVFKVGEISIKAIHTPGHTPESTCYLLKDENEKDKTHLRRDTWNISTIIQNIRITSLTFSTSHIHASPFIHLYGGILNIHRAVRR